MARKELYAMTWAEIEEAYPGARWFRQPNGHKLYRVHVSENGRVDIACKWRRIAPDELERVPVVPIAKYLNSGLVNQHELEIVKMYLIDTGMLEGAQR